MNTTDIGDAFKHFPTEITAFSNRCFVLQFKESLENYLSHEELVCLHTCSEEMGYLLYKYRVVENKKTVNFKRLKKYLL